MKKTIILCLAMMFAASVLYAEGGDKKSFWGNFLKKVSHLRAEKTEKKYKSVTAVCGIRGDREESADVLYWKGKESETPTVADEECDTFDTAVALAMDGKNDESLKRFEAFVTAYPESPLCKDANEAITKLKEDMKIE